MTPTARLAAAGFLATAVAFGPARMGFGLFLPTFRDTFALDTALAGTIASLGFTAFLLALPVAALLSPRAGQRAPVVLGASLAVAGFILAALATHWTQLAAGVALAGMSAGLCWSPFNDATERVVMASDRDGVLSWVASGTSIGVAVAGALALAVTLGLSDWRLCWAVFAAFAALAAASALIGVPGPPPAQPGPAPSRAPPFAYRLKAVPLYIAAGTFGATNAIYMSFAGDRVAQSGGIAGWPEGAAPGFIFLAYGLCGVLGVATGWAERRIGLRALLRVIFAAGALSLAGIGLSPGSGAVVLASAGMHGAALMTISAVISFWSLRLFPGRGAAGFTGTLTALAAGSVLGPVAAGVLQPRLGPEAMFLTLALPAAALVVIPLAPKDRMA